MSIIQRMSSGWVRQICGVALIAYSGLGFGQNSVYTVGTNFTTAYIDHQMIVGNGTGTLSDSSLRTTISIVGVNSGCATVEVPYYGFQKDVFLQKDSVANILLPIAPSYLQENVDKLGILITTTAPMMVIQSNQRSVGAYILGQNSRGPELGTASVLIPDHVLKDAPVHIPFGSCEGQYVYNSRPNWAIGTGSFDYKIVSAEKSNIVTINSSVGFSNGGNLPVDTAFPINMDRADGIKFMSGGTGVYGVRPTGGFIKFNSPPGKVYKVIRLSASLRVFDHSWPWGVAYEDMKPLEFADTTFYMPPLTGHYGNQYSLMATQDSTIIKFNGVQGLVLNKYQKLDTCIIGELKISANRPIMGYLAPCPDRYTNGNWNSPFSIAMSSTNELINTSHFVTFNQPDSTNHYMLSIATPTSGVSSLRLNDQPLNPSDFQPFSSNSSWSFATIEVKPGIYKITGDEGFHAFHYTYYNTPNPDRASDNFAFPSYGYTLGDSRILSPDSLKFKVGTSHSNLVPFSSFKEALCPGDEIYVQSGIQTNITWKYDFGDDTVNYQKTGQQGRQLIVHPYLSSGNYWLVVSDSTGCYPPDSVLIQVNDGAVAGFDYDITQSCEGYLVNLQPEYTANQYQWSWAGGSSHQRSPSFIYNGDPQELNVKLKVTESNCTDSISKHLELDGISAEISIPNIFTPNGDGFNDELCINDIAGYEACYSMQIFNRWGTEVFSSNSPTQCWTGEQVSDGVYFYILKIGANEFKGNITLQR